RCRALAVDQPAPLQPRGLELGVWDGAVDGAHPDAVVGGVLLAEEEDLAGELLTDLPREVRRGAAPVERADVGVGLLEARLLAARDRQVADDVQRVATSGSPAGH